MVRWKFRTKTIKLEKFVRMPKFQIEPMEMSEKIQMRIGEIEAADTVEDMIKYRIGRCHSLINNRKGQYAVDLVHPYRLVFEKHGNEIQIAHIMEIVDYH